MMDTKEMERLSKSMADFMGWEKSVCNINGGNRDCWYMGNYKKYSHDLLDYFHDPDSSNSRLNWPSDEKPNPRGLQPVLDKLESLVKYPDNIRISFGSCNCEGSWVDPTWPHVGINIYTGKDQFCKSFNATGPNRAFALYSAIDKLKGEK